MAKLKKKSNITRASKERFDTAEMAKRHIEHACLSMMDDLRVVFAYAAHNRLGYGKKRLERVERLCNDYLTLWRRDKEAETIVQLMTYARCLGHDHHYYGDQLPASFSWRHIEANLNKRDMIILKAPKCLMYSRNGAKIVILFIICSLDMLRRKYHDISKQDIREVLDAFILDIKCVSDPRSGVTIDDYRMVLADECKYTYGLQPGSWHDVGISINELGGM